MVMRLTPVVRAMARWDMRSKLSFSTCSSLGWRSRSCNSKELEK